MSYNKKTGKMSKNEKFADTIGILLYFSQILFLIIKLKKNLY